MFKLTANQRRVATVVALLVSYVSVGWASYVYSRETTAERMIEYMTDLCYNNTAIVQGSKDRYFYCMPVRATQQEKQKYNQGVV